MDWSLLRDDKIAKTGSMKKKKPSDDPDVKIVCRNRRARHDYAIEDTMEVGIVLVGTEVKSIRRGNVSLSDSYATIIDGEIFLVGAHIASYEMASHFNHEPKRQRKLLLHKRVINRLGIKIRERGYTLVPVELYFRKGRAKILLGLAKGRRQYDHRDAIRKKAERRELRDSNR
jgi:SsrA-binding protein